jgi:hypothetical protein
VETQQRLVDEAAKGAGAVPFEHTSSTIKSLSKADVSKTSPNSTLGRAIYGTLKGGTWKPAHLSSGKTMQGFVLGPILDMTNPTSQDLAQIGAVIGRDTEHIPLISLEKKFGDIGEGLKKAGFSAAIHMGPGSTGKHIAIFDPSQIKSADPITRDDSGNVIPPSQRFKPTTSDIRHLPEGNKKVKERQVIGDDMVIDKGDGDTLDIIQSVNAKTQMPSWKDDKPVPVSFSYDLASAPHINKFAGKVENPSTEFLDNLPYDLNRAEYGRVKSLIENGVVDHFANKMANETRVVLKDPAIAAGKGWYSRMRVKLLNALGETGRELFSQFLGATSARTPVDENFLQTVDAHEGMKSGRYDRHRKGYLTAIKAEMNGTLNKEIVKTKSIKSIQTILSKLRDALPLAKVNADKIAIYAEIKSLTDLIETPVDKRTEAQRINLYVVGNDLLPRRSNGAKFNANSGAVLKVIAGVWLNNRKSPKTPNFAGNLSGRTVQATIDIWAARYIRRMIYVGEGVPWRIQPKSEVGVSKEDFAFSQIVMERAARKLDMNPDDLQAILWFAEKDFWDKKKWTKNEGAKKSSFDDIFNIFFPEGKKPLSFAEGSAMINNAREQEKAIAKKEKKDNLKAEANALGISVAALTRMKKQKN